jgi:hypothetical protein
MMKPVCARELPLSIRLLRRARQGLGWLTPGLGVKRWIFVILAGTTLIGLGFAVLVLDVYRTAPDSWWLPDSFVSLAAFFSFARCAR